MAAVTQFHQKLFIAQDMNLYNTTENRLDINVNLGKKKITVNTVFKETLSLK